MNLLEKIGTKIETTLIGRRTWAMELMNFGQRLNFYRNTGEWPGDQSKDTLENFMTKNILEEIRDGKASCAQIKIIAARSAGLKVDIPIKLLDTLGLPK